MVRRFPTPFTKQSGEMRAPTRTSWAYEVIIVRVRSIFVEDTGLEAQEESGQ